GFNRQLHAFVNFVEDLGQLILRQGENDRDRLNLSDDHQAVVVGGMNDVARINQTQTNSARDGRSDARIGQLQLGVIYLPLIGLDGAIELADRRALSVELLFWNYAFLIEQFVALQVDFGILALRLILGELSLGLLQLNLKRTWVDFPEKIARFYV